MVFRPKYRDKHTKEWKTSSMWWYKFTFCGQVVRESAKTRSKTVAIDAQRTRRRQIEEGFNGLHRRSQPRLLSAAASEWLEGKRGRVAPKTYKIEEVNLAHLLPVLGRHLVSDIDARDIARYQDARTKEGAAGGTVNLEFGTLRAILRKARVWANIQPDVKMLPARSDVGLSLPSKDESKLLAECGKSRSKALLPAFVVAMNTGLRYSELVGLRWGQVDFAGKRLTVGKSKTEAGDGRVVPLNPRALDALSLWASRFDGRSPAHFVFPSEKYGQPHKERGQGAYATDPTKPLKRLKEAWEGAKERAEVSCRWHDLRHSFCTRLLEAGVGFPIVAEIMGWSASMAVRMAKRYGHIGHDAKRVAVESIFGAGIAPGWSRYRAKSDANEKPEQAN
jgi:integrase